MPIPSMNFLINAERAKETQRSQKDNAFKSLCTLRFLCALCVRRIVAEVHIAFKEIDVSRWLSHSDFQVRTFGQACFFSLFLFLSNQLYSQFHHSCSHKKQLMTSAVSRLDSMDVVDQQLFLDFTFFGQQELSGIAQTQVAIHQNVDVIHLDLWGMVVDSVQVNGTNASFLKTSHSLWVYYNGASGDTILVTSYYHGSPETDASWGGFYYNSQYAYNLGIGFTEDPHCLGRAWHPCIDDFNDRTSYHLVVKTLPIHAAYCGGVLSSETTDADGNRWFEWDLSQPIPSYLASVAVGQYVRVEEDWVSEDGDVIPIWLAAKSTDTTNFKNSLINLPSVTTHFENRFGPYPFDRVGYVAVPFNGGAMEHAGNIAYPLFAINGNLAYETLYAHELSHMWWGDAVTCASQEDMWLNEGWASYCESVALEGLYGSDAYWEEQKSLHKEVLTSTHVTDGGWRPVSGVPHSLTYGSTVYRKGAWVVHNLRHVMGDAAFFSACRDYQSQRAFSSHSSSDLMAFFQGYTSHDLATFFNTFVFQPGFPEYRVKSFSVEPSDVPVINMVTIQVEHHLHHQSAFNTGMPIELAFRKPNGDWEYQGYLHTEPVQTVMIGFDFVPTDVVINRNGNLHQAALAEERMLYNTGNVDLTYADFSVNPTDMGGADSIWFRAENHFAEAEYHPYLAGTDWYVSPDRILEVHWQGGEETVLSGKWRFYQSNAAEYDSAFFAQLNAWGMNEDSVHLLYRPFTGENWSLYLDATLNTMGSANNGNGRFDFTRLLPGQYTLAAHTGVLSVESQSNNPWALWNQSTLRVMQTMDTLDLLDVQGKLCQTWTQLQPQEEMRIQLSAGTYVLRAQRGNQSWNSKIHIIN